MKKSDIVIGLHNTLKMDLTNISRNATDAQLKSVITNIFENVYPSTSPNNQMIKQQLDYIVIDRQVEIARYYLNNSINTSGNPTFNLSTPLINIANNALEEERTSGVNGRNTSNGYNENQLYDPNDKRGSYPIINGF